MAEVDFRITVSSLNTGRETKYSPISGVINSAIIQFPPGCNFLVEVYIHHKNNQILPTPSRSGGASFTDYGITLDSTTQSFEINESIEKDEPISVEVINHDEAYSHTIPVIILISDTKSYTGP